MKKLTANWGLKLASLIFAAIIWFLVTNINDPIISVRYTNVPVTIKNGNLITEKGQVYTVLDNSDTINSVTIYAPRTVIDSLSQSNVVATADIQNLSSLNTVSIDIQTNKYSDKIDRFVLSSDVVKLNVERKASKSLALSATTSGSLADGYVIGDVTTEQNMVRISGPESFVNSVYRAAVDVDVTGFTSNIGTDADIVLYDVDGNAMDLSQSGVSMNIKTVRANVQILETKYVPINLTITGAPVAGYVLTGEVDVDPLQVLIAGRSSAIAAVSAINVESEELDVTGINSNLSKTIDLKEFLPSGVVFGDPDFSGTVSIIVHVAPILERTYEVDIRNISVENNIEGYNVYVDDTEYDRVSLTLYGLKSNLDEVSAGSLRGTVDVNSILRDNGLEELKPGTYSATVTWNYGDSVYQNNPISVYVVVEEKE